MQSSADDHAVTKAFVLKKTIITVHTSEINQTEGLLSGTEYNLVSAFNDVQKWNLSSFGQKPC